MPSPPLPPRTIAELPRWRTSWGARASALGFLSISREAPPRGWGSVDRQERLAGLVGRVLSISRNLASILSIYQR